ncbi:MAG: hypothetical protein M5U34_47885 [Chloroflexi bacterium]|nr:hypothetical protein [Chloroflexota bacterium]
MDGVIGLPQGNGCGSTDIFRNVVRNSLGNCFFNAYIFGGKRRLRDLIGQKISKIIAATPASDVVYRSVDMRGNGRCLWAVEAILVKPLFG